MDRKRVGDVAETLLHDFEHNTTFQAAASYTNPHRWRAEVDLIFKRVPLLLALTCEMPKAGNYKAMEVLGLPILITRDGADTVRAFLNACSHRGTTQDHPSNMTHYQGFRPHIRGAHPLRSIPRLREVPREQWEKLENECFTFLRTIFPNVTSYLSQRKAVFTQIFPGPTPDRNLTVRLFARKEPWRDEEDRRLSLEQAIRQDLDVAEGEDYAVGERVQKGLESEAHAAVVLGSNERGNQYFHEWLNWYLADDTSLPKPVM